MKPTPTPCDLPAPSDLSAPLDLLGAALPVPALMKARAERWAKELPSTPQVWGIGLFGSHARGEARASSDIDILLLIDEVPRRSLYYAVDEYFHVEDARIQASILKRIADPAQVGSFALEIAPSIITLWERDEAMTRWKGTVARGGLELGWRRRTASGYPVWERI